MEGSKAKNENVNVIDAAWVKWDRDQASVVRGLSFIFTLERRTRGKPREGGSAGEWDEDGEGEGEGEEVTAEKNLPIHISSQGHPAASVL